MVKTNRPGLPRSGKGPVAGRLPGAEVLGVDVQRKTDLIGKVKAGFPFKHLVNLEKRSGLSRERIAQFMAIPLRTLTRRQREGHLNAAESDRLLRGARVFEMVVELFEGDVDQARNWLLASNSALGGANPLEFTSTEVGAREVESLIGRLEHGVFT